MTIGFTVVLLSWIRVRVTRCSVQKIASKLSKVAPFVALFNSDYKNKLKIALFVAKVMETSFQGKNTIFYSIFCNYYIFLLGNSTFM